MYITIQVVNPLPLPREALGDNRSFQLRAASTNHHPVTTQNNYRELEC